LTGRPLQGLRVVEGSAFVAAPSGGMTLAQLGADVIRFDQIGGGIDHKRWPLTENGVSLYWNGLNKGKRSLAVNLRDSEAQELLSALIAKTGNFITNFPATGWLDYDRLRTDREDLVMVSIVGSHDGTTAVDYTVNCAIGYPNATGYPDDPRPVNNVVPAWDLMCGQMAALGLLAADRYRFQTGHGDLVTLALTDVALAAAGMLGGLAEAQINRSERLPIGNDLYGAYGTDFVTEDNRRVMVVAISSKQWKGLQEATNTSVQVGELASRLGVDFSDEGERFLAREELTEIFLPWFKERTFVEVSRELDDYGVCWGPYQSFIELVDEDARCSIDNPLFSDLNQPGVGKHLVPGSPLAFSQTQDRGSAIAPQLGEHTEQILSEDLGLTPAAIGALIDRGIVANA
tara:strand:+ start:1063 stop:2268 length:1206 start_codon:yes stop_codon:yes gene_type:complete